MKGRDLVAWNLRRLRLANELSQEHLADEADVDRAYLGRLERAEENSSVDLLDRLVGALNCRLADLFVAPEPGATQPEPLKRGRKPKG